MYIVIEKRLTMIRDHLPGFHLLCLVAGGVLLYSIWGMEDMRTLKKIGSTLGNGAAIMGGVCLSYYCLRELFVKLKKANRLSELMGIRLRDILSVLRLLHPIAGFLMGYLLLLHGAIMLHRAVVYPDSIILFGILAALIFVVMLFLGIYIKKRIAYRLYHRYLAIALIVAYIGHLSLHFNVYTILQ